jgi:hypothetical protein
MRPDLRAASTIAAMLIASSIVVTTPAFGTEDGEADSKESLPAAPDISTAPAPTGPDVLDDKPATSDDPASGDESETDAIQAASPLVVMGYIDVGYVKAGGNGSSFRPGDTRVPADYGVDPFAPAVNSRGEVASTDSRGVFTNGFLPRSVGIGGAASFLLNTADVDFRYTPPELPVMIFTRLQLMPRFDTDESTASEYQQLAFGQLVTRVLLEQAFGRLTPLKSSELAISIGKFDSVFGIEYLDNQANFRVGVTPSLMARYTTGQSVGVKLFYRYQIPAILGAVTLNGAATNGGTFVESLQAPDRSLTGLPVWSGRLGVEINLARVSIKLGASGVLGPRNDQLDASAEQALWGIDGRIVSSTLTLSGELVHVSESESSIPGKLTGLGMFPIASGFLARGFWLQAAEELPLGRAPIRVTLYGRYDHRHAAFHGFTPVTVDRITLGMNLGLADSLQLKGEVLVNRELEGAPQVDNNVYTSSAVWTW